MVKITYPEIGVKACGPDGGFTLVEVLISTIVLSALVYLATFSYSLFIDAWGDRSLKDRDAINSYRSHMLMRSSIESAYDYYVTDRANEKNGLYYPFFKGKEDSIEFVTLSSIFHEGVPALARLRLTEPEEDTGGLQQVILEETQLDRQYIKYSDDSPEYKDSLVVYDQVNAVAIRYYGAGEPKWNSERESFESTYKWYKTFNGNERNALPTRIEITIAMEEGDQILLYSTKAKNVYKRQVFQGHV